jgi:carboxymethylenebutenolidase
MVTLTRPDGNWVGDLDLSRRRLAQALAGGYAVAAFSCEAKPVTTDAKGLSVGMVEFPAADRAIPGYLARPEGKGRHATILVYSEVFGVHEWVRDICRRLAHAGYAALAPDFFVRHGDPSKLTDFGEIGKIVAQASDEQVTGDTAAALKWLEAQPFADRGRMGVTGFCWGGAKVWLAVARFADFKAGVAWYGPIKGSPRFPAPPAIDLVKQLHAPVLGLYGGQDQGIPQADVEAMRAALKAAGQTQSQIVVFPDAQHGFAADYRPSYDPTAAADGWKRMLAFFAQHGVK